MPIVPPDPVSNVKPFPATPAFDAVNCNVDPPSTALRPIPNAFAVPILATKLSTAVEASEPVGAKKIPADVSSAGWSSAGPPDAIILNSVPAGFVICNSSPSSVKNVAVNTSEPVAATPATADPEPAINATGSTAPLLNVNPPPANTLHTVTEPAYFKYSLTVWGT